MSIVYLNGRFLPLEEACVPVLDRGFLFGDGVYEVIPVYAGRLFRLEQHLARLADSLAGIRIANPLSLQDWTRILQDLVAQNGGGDQSLYLQITRGVGPKRDHAFPEQTVPTALAMTSPLTPPDPGLAETGVAAVTLEDIRWKYCHIKAITLLSNVLLRQQAVDDGAQEAILIRDGEATEGTASNIFIVKDGLIVTPPKGPFLLPGITRDLILELAEAHHLPFREATVRETDLRTADEIWLSSSTREVLPVTTLDGTPVGSGRPGPLWSRIRTIYQDYKRSLGAAVRTP